MGGLLLLFFFYRFCLRAFRYDESSDTDSDSSKGQFLLQHRERLLKQPLWTSLILFFCCLLMDLVVYGLPIFLLAAEFRNYQWRLHDRAAHVDKGRYYPTTTELHVSELGWSDAVVAREIGKLNCADNPAHCGASLFLY